jgi:putative ABC transport system permease protein
LAGSLLNKPIFSVLPPTKLLNMLSNFLKLSIRRLRQNRFFSILQIGGLALGIAAALLLWTYISSELTFNQYHDKVAQLYRVIVLDNKGEATDYTPPALAPWLKREFPEVKEYARTNSNGAGVVSCFGTSLNTDKPRNAFREEASLAYADGGLFRLFSFEPKAGKLDIDRAQEVAISAAYAQKYFGNDDPLGMTLKLDNQFGGLPYTIVGVFEDMPSTSDYRFDLMFSLKTLENPANLNGNDWASLATWYSSSYATFVELEKNTSLATLEKKANVGLEKIFPDHDFAIRFQRLDQMHLGRSNQDPYPTFGNRSLVLALSGITFLILFIAWINYVNISTAQSHQQAQNVGIRRTVGATRTEVAGQYAVDSLLLMVLGILFSIPLILLMQPYVSNMIGRDINPVDLLNNSYAWIFAAVVLLGTAISGAYVAWLLSGVQPIQMLAKQWKGTPSRFSMRNVLVVTQFSISILFILGTLILQTQLTFMQNKNLGMNLNQLLVIRGPEGSDGDEKIKRLNTFRNELGKFSWVEDYCFTGCLPGETFSQNFRTEGFSSKFSDPASKKKSYVVAMIDHLFQPTYEIQFAAGENFSAEDARNGYTQSNQVILNETAAREMGFDRPAEAAGQNITWNDQALLVKGVLKDYHHRGLQQAIDPMVFLPASNSSLISVRLSTQDLPKHLGQLQSLFAQLFPAEPYDYYFEQEDFNRQYTAEHRLGQISSASAMIAILLSCLGLLGLITHSIGRRTKEIGIRKVLGASVASVTGLLTLDFLKLVVVAIFIASPIAWYVMHQWLANFAYHIGIEWWMFVAAGALALLIAFLTVCVQSIKAALANPVEVLKSE